VLFASAICVQSAYTQDATSGQQTGGQQSGRPDKTQDQMQARDSGRTQAKAQDEASLARAAAGCGRNEIQFDVKTNKTQHPQAPADAARAVIYVFSGAEFPNVRIGMDGRWMGANHGESYFFFMAEPGEHRLCWDVQKGQEKLSDQGAATTFTAEAGKVYFFRTTLRGHELVPEWKFERIDGAEGLFLVSSWPLSTSSPKPQHED
jgi:hypothetical protein